VIEAKPTISQGSYFIQNSHKHELMDKVTDSWNHLVSDCPHNTDAYNVNPKIGLFCEMKFQMPKNFIHTVMVERFLKSYE
jgi:hypothetical protein